MSNPWFIQYQNYFGINAPYYIDSYNLAFDFPLHRHDFIEIEFILSGKGKEYVNGTSFELEKGSLSIMMPWHTHELISDARNPLKICKCSFNTEFLISDNSQFGELSDILIQSLELPPITTLNTIYFEKVKQLFEELTEEYRNLELWKNTLVATKITEIIIYFDRCRKIKGSTIPTESQKPEDFNIWKVIEYIHSCFNQDLTIADIAEKFHYSESHLNKLLKDNIGLTFNDLLQETRVRNACTLLMYPIIPINDISSLVGYKTRASLYRAFEKVKGMSPEKYRKMTTENQSGLNRHLTFSVLNAQIVYYLHLHYRENITLSDLAQAFHYNKTYLSKTLMDNGVSFTDLLHEIRIYHACALLLTTENKINEIGFTVGFNSTKSFYRIFKKNKGMSPGQFRSQNRVEHYKPDEKE